MSSVNSCGEYILYVLTCGSGMASPLYLAGFLPLGCLGDCGLGARKMRRSASSNEIAASEGGCNFREVDCDFFKLNVSEIERHKPAIAWFRCLNLLLDARPPIKDQSRLNVPL